MSFTGGLSNRTCGSVLIVDSDVVSREQLAQLLVASGHRVSHADDATQAGNIALHDHFDVVVLDVQRPDDLALLSQLRSLVHQASIVVLSHSDDPNDMREASERGAQAYLRKPIDARSLEAQVCWALTKARTAAAQMASHGGLPGVVVQSDGDLVGGLLDALPMVLARQLSHAWDLRHVETGAHVRRMSESARRLALALGTPEATAQRLGEVAMLHDIGKIAIPDAILTKPGKLTTEEFEIMKRHSQLGETLLSGSGHPFLELAARVARSHHERWNGTGYPDGLVGEACPWEARVVGVVDVFDALAETRCYKEGWPRARIVEFFRAERGRSFDPDMTDALLSIVPDLEIVKSMHPDPPLPRANNASQHSDAVAVPHHG